MPSKISPFELHTGSEKLMLELMEVTNNQSDTARQLQMEYDDPTFTRSAVLRRLRKLGHLAETPKETPDEAMLRHLISKGYQLVKEPIVDMMEYVVDTSRFTGDTVKFGVLADTHLCSKYQQLTYLNQAYNFFVEQGITDVLHAGDLTAGNGRVYKGQVYELFRQGADETMEYVIEHYPKREGITTHVIAGNHDLSFLASDGLDILKAVATQRTDINYLGHYSAMLTFGKLKVGLHHGEGGCSYARSYKLQKLIEQLAPENKPHAFFLGHYHVACGLEQYRNVFARMLPCFEAQTPYLVRKGLYPELGFYIVKALLNPVDREDGVTNFRADYYPFYVPKKQDY
jgi:predicted phosphodiesterase